MRALKHYFARSRLITTGVCIIIMATGSIDRIVQGHGGLKPVGIEFRVCIRTRKILAEQRDTKNPPLISYTTLPTKLDRKHTHCLKPTKSLD